MRIGLLWTIIISLLLSGCMTYSERRLVGPEPKFVEGLIINALPFQLTLSSDFDKGYVPNKTNFAKALSSYFEEQPYITSSQEFILDKLPTTAYLDIKVTAKPNRLAIKNQYLIDILSPLIPFWFEHEVEVVIDYVRNGKVYDRVLARETIKEYRWGPLLLGYPAHNYDTTSNTLARDVGQITLRRMASNGFLDPIIEKKAPTPKSNAITMFGTGFYIHQDGYLLTNHHVVKNGQCEIKGLENRSVTLLATDENKDIALMKVNAIKRHILPFSRYSAPLGYPVHALGYPAPQLLGFNVKYTSGVISGLYGLEKNPDHYQISVPIQVGNSGSPLLNDTNEIVGMVVSQVNDRKFEKYTKRLPQNINYAIKRKTLQAFLKQAKYKPKNPINSRMFGQPEKATVLLKCVQKAE